VEQQKFVGDDDDFKVSPPQNKKVQAVAQKGTVFVLDVDGKFVIVDSDKQGRDAVLGVMSKTDKPSFVDELVKTGHYRYLQPPIALDMSPVAKNALSTTNGGGPLVMSNISSKKYERPDEE